VDLGARLSRRFAVLGTKSRLSARVPTLPQLRWRRSLAIDPSVSLFRRIRWSLTAWYAGILGVTLLVMGVVLYEGERQSLLAPVDDNLHSTAQQLVADWRSELLVPFPTTGALPCPQTRGLAGSFLYACYDTSGTAQDSAPIWAVNLQHFADPALIRGALKSGQATETVDSNNVFSPLRLYAVRLSDPSTGRAVGVIELGAYIGDRTTALNRLLYLLVLCGSLGVLFALVSGIFLAHRSLRPVRLAYMRQQDFVANASHELRTPLTMVRADAEVLLRDREHLTEDQITILEDVVDEASHMASLATSMLELARLDAGKLRVDREVIDLVVLGHEMARRAEALAHAHRITISVDDGPPVLIFGDPLLVEHVLLILIDNAIKYNHPGGLVSIRASVEGRDAVLEVRDTGIGIEAEHIPHLGERFYRVDKARSREAGGAGLGLSIVRGVLAEHDGAFTLTSDPGVGTTARVTFPAMERQPVV
jgi:signal transduction histidine kinase